MDGNGTVTTYGTKDWKQNGKPMVHPQSDDAYNFHLSVSDDGKWLATSDNPGENNFEGQLQLWDAVANTPLGEPIVAMNGLTARFLGNNRILIMPGRGDANVRDLPSMKIAYSLRPHDDVYGPSVDILPDKKWILSWGPDRIVNLYDAATGKLATNKSAAATMSEVMMAPDSSACYVVFETAPSFSKITTIITSSK